LQCVLIDFEFTVVCKECEFPESECGE